MIWLLGCGPEPLRPRAPGARAPQSAPCDALDETRCLLPWPSNTFTVPAPETPTGLRVSITSRSLPVRDNPASLNRLDGFSVATPLAVGFPERLAASVSGQRATNVVRLFAAQPGEAFGKEVPLRLFVVQDSTSGADLLLAYPMWPLAYDTDYVAVVLDEVRPESGGVFPVPRAVQVALGVVKASDEAERLQFAYHAPARTLLTRAGLDPTRVLRVWDFTTRSAGSHARPMDVMRARALEVVAAQGLKVNVVSALGVGDGGVEVLGSVGGLPRFLGDAGVLALGNDGLPVETGLHDVPFRAVLPRGAGPLSMVIFGHGTGGDVHDSRLDAEILSTGAGKLNVEFAGWSGSSVPSTFIGFERVLTGTERSTSGLAQSLVDASALEAALAAQLGAALSAPLVGSVANPASGRTFSRLGYFGSSLGGTVGFAHAQLEPRIDAAVLNVPGAGCGQFMWHAEQWAQLDVFLEASTPSSIDRALGLALSQTNWDLIDGAAWSAQPGLARKPLLIQEAIGDTVLPNLGSELVASSAGAVQLSRVIVPVAGVDAASEAVERPALTQFRLSAAVTDSGEIHAFVTGPSPAGIAARQQLTDFFTSVWAGAARASEPAACRANGDDGCDFALSP